MAIIRLVAGPTVDRATGSRHVYEVEIKYRLADAAWVEEELARRGARFSAPLEQVDRYYAHPCRDFAATDEALRIRRSGAAVVITWKGPRVGTDSKTRREIELPLGTPGQPAEATLGEWHALLGALGFTPVREVAKQRWQASIEWQGGAVEVSIDRVPGLGDFLEIEVLAAEGQVPVAEARLRALAADLGCGTPECRSYLEMVIAHEGQG